MESGKETTFEDLLVWQKGITLVKRIYEITARGRLQRRELHSLLRVVLEIGYLS